jgi:1-acyl-sn-glycerol-3-phosphate acyltransferase
MSDISPTQHKPYPHPFNPTRLKMTRQIMRWLGNFLMRMLTKTTVSGMENVPSSGPTMVVFNHVTSFDPEIVGLSVNRRNVVPLGKIELTENLLTAWIMWGWGAIPIKRGEVDRTALKKAQEVLLTPNMLLISPEGHRNKHGLANPKEGTILIANQGHAVILPVGVSGTEHILSSIKKFRRAKVEVVIGKPFRVKQGVNRKLYEQSVNELMYQIAHLIDPALRGDFSDLSKATMETLEYI